MGIFNPSGPPSDKNQKIESPPNLIPHSLTSESLISLSYSLGEERDRIIAQTPIQEGIFLEETASTNDWAKNYLATQNQGSTTIASPLLILAQRQTGGRGRGSHVWWSPEGGLYFTLLASWQDFRLTRDQSVELSLKTAKSVAETISQILSGPHQNQENHQKNKAFLNSYHVEIHPPNDVYVDGKKIAGILIESPTPRWVLIGIGVNLNTPVQEAPPEIRDKIISLRFLLGKSVNFSDFLIPFLRQFLA